MVQDFNPNYNLDCETVLSRSETAVSLTLFVSQKCSFFDGHFPEFKLLPAVGQFALLSHLAEKYFGIAGDVSRIRRMKFSLPILPDSLIRIDLEFIESRNEVSFVICDAEDSGKVYSSGKFL